MTSIIQQVRPDVEKVLLYSQGLDKADGLDTILPMWYKAKERFIERFGGLIADCGHVEFELSVDEQQKRLNEFINTIEYNYDNGGLAQFLDSTRKDFFKNRLSQDYVDTYLNIRIPKEMKIIKAFKYFLDDGPMLKELQDQASMIIQENKVNGNLYLSVHPLDYLSSSENNYHWRSCHALDGDYRAGNISYMLDNCTVVAYLAHPLSKEKLPRFPEDVLWNSKKWRMLLFVDEFCESMMAGRQYPFFSRTGLDAVGKAFLGESAWTYHWAGWYNDYIVEFPRDGYNGTYDRLLNGRHISMDCRIYRMEDIVKDAKYSRHYNDLLYSSVYIPYYTWTKYPRGNRVKPKFLLGSEVQCVRCGNELIEEGDTMVCEDCAHSMDHDDDQWGYCGCCGAHVLADDMTYLSGPGYYICPECATHTQICDTCGHSYLEGNMAWNKEKNIWECDWCSGRLGRYSGTWDTLPF